MSGLQRVGVALVVLTPVGACSSDAQPTNTTAAPTTTATTTSAPTTTTDVAARAGLGKPIALTCRDSATAGVPASPDDLSAAGLTFTDVSALDHTSGGEAPIVVDSRTFTFRKIFIYVGPDAAPVTTLTLVGPTDSGLFYQPLYAEPGSPPISDEDELDASTTTVSFEGCGKTTTGYIGGIVVAGPSCVELRVSGDDPGQPPVTIRLPILEGTC